VSDRRKQRQAEVEAQKLRTLKATMRTVQDIVNNFLNNLLLFEMEAQGKVAPHELDKLEDLARQTYDRLKSLADVESVRESPMGISPGIAYPEPAATGRREVREA
jgi:hypothetical protein